MNAAFFGLAALSALNPKLLIVDLILATNQRPRLMFMYFLLGGMGLGITVGLLDVFVVHLDAITRQNHASGGLDLALGVALAIVGALLATNHMHIHRQPQSPPRQKAPSKLESWAVRTLHEPRYGLAFLIGAAVGTPGAAYLVALHNLVASKTPAAVAVIAVLVFVTITFALVIVPFGFYLVHPKRTEDAVKLQGLDRQSRAADRGHRSPARGRVHGDQRHAEGAELTSGAQYLGDGARLPSRRCLRPGSPQPVASPRLPGPACGWPGGISRLPW
jgi:hypothetical protein